VGPGDEVQAGTPLLELHTDTPDRLPAARRALTGAALLIVAEPDVARPRDLVLDTVRSV
ncbi:MAG: thymidine phosphorylase, partial [Actinomycetota bacterium]|nr:thymidine phosphorylase [Actinomycetota bacterium]